MKKQGNKHEFEKIQKERDEFLEGWKRAKAELLNAKKDMAEQFGRFSERVEMEFAEDVLPVLDALSEAEKSEIEGLVPIKRLMESILKRKDIEEICPTEGEEFDPNVHEAVAGQGTRIEECLQRGFMYKNKLIRPAKVTVKE